MCQMEVALLQGRRPGDASVENVGIKVRSVRPNYGTQLRIDAELGEVGGIAQRLEDSVEAEIGREIDHALNAIFEPKMQATIAERFCGNNAFNTIYSRGAMGLSCAACLAKFQSSINSARGERRPVNRARVSMAMSAFWPACRRADEGVRSGLCPMPGDRPTSLLAERSPESSGYPTTGGRRAFRAAGAPAPAGGQQSKQPEEPGADGVALLQRIL